MAAKEPFVEGWDFIQTLGEGAYGEVKLAVNRTTQEAVAVKIIKEEELKNQHDSLKKEVCIHKMLIHPHIIRFFGQRTEDLQSFIFLEYAPGGELFDRIEPDIGMATSDARNYFMQLLAGIEFLHSKGVTHRDIKPENLLLDANNNLKISDFGLSTIFRYKSKERLLDRCCGTPPYIAPEVLNKEEYNAEPADVWSCGIVLVAMLAGELPWDEPRLECKEYKSWLSNGIHVSPWSKIDTASLCLLKNILNPSPKTRSTISQIKHDPWFTRLESLLENSFKASQEYCTSDHHSSGFQRRFSDKESTPVALRSQSKFSASQPNPSLSNDATKISNNFITASQIPNYQSESLWVSQPAHLDAMVLSQFHGTQGSSQNPIHHLAKRMTRFRVSLNCGHFFTYFLEKLACLSLTYKILSPRQISIVTTDRRKNSLSFRVCLIEVPQQPLLADFRLSKGDGIEFKRQFRRIKDAVSEHLT